MEKALKAHVAKRTESVPPRIHNLARLAEIAGIALNREQKSLFGDLMEYHISARYDELGCEEPAAAQAREWIEQAQEVIAWLMNEL